jgi:hypothetical protein
MCKIGASACVLQVAPRPARVEAPAPSPPRARPFGSGRWVCRDGEPVSSWLQPEPGLELSAKPVGYCPLVMHGWCGGAPAPVFETRVTLEGAGAVGACVEIHGLQARHRPPTPRTRSLQDPSF